MPTSTGITSFILAEVESSREGTSKFGNYLLTIGDCHQQILLEFKLATQRQRRLSLAKIGWLRKTLADFESALRKEAILIEEQESALKKKSRVRHRK